MKAAGSSTREMARQRLNSAKFYILLLLAVVAVLLAVSLGAPLLGSGGFGILALILLLRVVLDILEEQAQRRLDASDRAAGGAAAEEAIADLLAGLGEDYLVLHDLWSYYGNIDHLVLSKSGAVFLLETKSHRGKVTVVDGSLLLNGKPPEKNFIAQALRNAYWVREEIQKEIGETVWITPVLVFTQAFVPSISPVKGVMITNQKFLLSVLCRGNRNGGDSSRVWEMRQKLAGSFTYDPTQTEA